ncbi:ABC-type nitrate/sulfonate/bicarbonate transport system ATPase subunit [Paraburkholderia sp. WC7.3g]
MDVQFREIDLIGANGKLCSCTHFLDIWRSFDVTVLFITHGQDEAIFLADRIVVPKANPGEVQELIQVPVPRPRDYSQVTSPASLAIKARLEALIHPPTAAHDDEDVSRRACQPSDSVALHP